MIICPDRSHMVAFPFALWKTRRSAAPTVIPWDIAIPIECALPQYQVRLDRRRGMPSGRLRTAALVSFLKGLPRIAAGLHAALARLAAPSYPSPPRAFF